MHVRMGLLAGGNAHLTLLLKGSKSCTSTATVLKAPVASRHSS